MLCHHCGKESDPVSRVCPYCGRYMGGEPEEKPLLGEAVPIYDDSDYWAEPRRAPIRHSERQKQKRRLSRSKRKPRRKDGYRRFMINWAMVGLVIGILLFVSILGGYVYLKMTPNGQLILARMGREASADAYWTLGTELLDQGYIARAVGTYEHALNLEPDHPKLQDKLMLLAEGYEAAGMAEQAEAVYVRIYTSVSPKDPIGYRNAIRLMLQREDGIAQATDLMQLAFEKTEDASFETQRAGLVPLPPTATKPAGPYMLAQTIGFESPQGYAIYYATGDEQLPEEGTLYTEPLLLGEGVHNFRAVCVSSIPLISDEMKVRYVISLPSPPAPKCNLAPKSYEGVRYVKLRDMETDTKDPLKKTRIYYTLDGRPANADSPEYLGEPIKLPGGKVTLQAVAINGYGKMSNQMVVQYTIKNVKWKGFFDGSDEMARLSLMKTTLKDFVGLYGEPESNTKVEDDAVAGECRLLTYPWGEARFCQIDDGGRLYDIKTRDAGMTGPRGSKVGMALEDVYALYRDMGQPANTRGDRGIYYDLVEGYANFVASENDPRSGELLYVATLYDETASTRLLTYQVEAGKVTSIQLRYVDRKLSNVLQ